MNSNSKQADSETILELSENVPESSSHGSRTSSGNPSPKALEPEPMFQNQSQNPESERAHPIPRNTDHFALSRQKEIADRVKSKTQLLELFDQPGWKSHIHDIKFIIECLTVIIGIICSQYNSLINDSGNNPRTAANLFLLSLKEYFIKKYPHNQSGVQTDAP